jgi:hypothetical protein
MSSNDLARDLVLRDRILDLFMEGSWVKSGLQVRKQGSTVRGCPHGKSDLQGECAAEVHCAALIVDY